MANSMEYILMRHADDSGLNDTYCKVRDIARRNGITLQPDEILERLVSLAIDTVGSYVHDEVIEIVKQREESIEKTIREYNEEARRRGYPDIVYPTKNVLAETINRMNRFITERMNHMISGRTLTIAYNDVLRTEFTARAVAKVTGGNLVAGELKEANDVYQWMQVHSGEDGLSVIVTHEPAILRLLPIGRELKYSSAYFVGDVANVGKTFQQI